MSNMPVRNTDHKRRPLLRFMGWSFVLFLLPFVFWPLLQPGILRVENWQNEQIPGLLWVYFQHLSGSQEEAGAYNHVCQHPYRESFLPGTPQAQVLGHLGQPQVQLDATEDQPETWKYRFQLWQGGSLNFRWDSQQQLTDITCGS